MVRSPSGAVHIVFCALVQGRGGGGGIGVGRRGMCRHLCQCVYSEARLTIVFFSVRAFLFHFALYIVYIMDKLV